MIRVFEDYYSRMRVLRDEAVKVIDSMPQDALDWTPSADINSVAVLTAHISGSILYWVADVVGQQDTGRDRESEFRVRGLDSAALRTRLDTSMEAVRQTLDGLELEDLVLMRIARRNQQEYSVSAALSHALEHMALHVGQMQLMIQFWQMATGSRS